MHCFVTVNNIILQSYYQGAVGAFVVYDITKKESLDHCQKWKEDIDSKIQLITGDPIPTVLIANKVLYNYMDFIIYLYMYMQIDITRDSHYDGKQFSIEHNFANYFKTSAKTGEGFRDAIHFMLQEVHSYQQLYSQLVAQQLASKKEPF